MMKFDDKLFLAAQIKKYRKNAGLTQEELAEKVDLTTQHISRIESGCYIPSLKSFFLLAEVLNFDLKEFGFNIKNTNSKIKDNLINIISNADDKEIIFYESVVNSIKNSFSRLKKSLLL